MAIVVKQNKFWLKTKNTMYQMQVDDIGALVHIWYGERTDDDMSYLAAYKTPAFSPNPSDVGGDIGYSFDLLTLEYSCGGIGDYRASALEVVHPDGSCGVDLRYAEHRITKGKYSIKGLPASYGDNAETLEIVLCDNASKMEVVLRYGVFEDCDVITRCACIKNGGDGSVMLKKAQSLCLDLPAARWDWIHFYGKHLSERTPQRVPIINGIQESSSRRGTSSHQQNPTFIICSENCTEISGECYGAAFVYSGSFKTEIERSQQGGVRAVMGIHPDLFSWELRSGECFETPEVLLAYSGKGFERLSHSFHRIIRNNVCRGEYKLAERPVLINSWEAMHFDFDEKKLLDFARTAGEMGVDMLVLDDGWFGNRNDDTSGLGDWFENRDKLKNGLKGLAQGLEAIGMKLGLWIEPEMISEDSDLYRSHPDWVIEMPDRKPARCRNQLVLDMANSQVVDYLYEVFSRILRETRISYIKWDMNRSICDWYSPTLSPKNQGEAPHRYILGLYDLLERLTSEFPHILFEGCSGGGGRFDAGMLYYTPQIWCSDNTDAFVRTGIHYGTSFFYPVSCIGSHISAVPNHQTGRTTPFETRSIVAMHGSFGYELDLDKLPETEKKQVSEQVKKYKQLRGLIHDGEYFRLSNPFEENFSAWEYVSEDRCEALVDGVKFRALRSDPLINLRLRGLDPEKSYRINDGEAVFSGKALMYGGVLFDCDMEDYTAFRLHIWAV